MWPSCAEKHETYRSSLFGAAGRRRAGRERRVRRSSPMPKHGASPGRDARTMCLLGPGLVIRDMKPPARNRLTVQTVAISVIASLFHFFGIQNKFRRLRLGAPRSPAQGMRRCAPAASMLPKLEGLLAPAKNTPKQRQSRPHAGAGRHSPCLAELFIQCMGCRLSMSSLPPLDKGMT